MTTTGNEELVAIQPKHLRLMRFHLSQYHDLLCKQAEAGEKVKEINELGLLDYVIDTLLRWYEAQAVTRSHKNAVPTETQDAHNQPPTHWRPIQ